MGPLPSCQQYCSSFGGHTNVATTLCIAVALSSPSFEISEVTQLFKSRVTILHRVNKKIATIHLIFYGIHIVLKHKIFLGLWEFKMASNRTIELLIVILAKLIMV